MTWVAFWGRLYDIVPIFGAIRDESEYDLSMQTFSKPCGQSPRAAGLAIGTDSFGPHLDPRTTDLFEDWIS